MMFPNLDSALFDLYASSTTGRERRAEVVAMADDLQAVPTSVLIPAMLRIVACHVREAASGRSDLANHSPGFVFDGLLGTLDRDADRPRLQAAIAILGLRSEMTGMSGLANDAARLLATTAAETIR